MFCLTVLKQALGAGLSQARDSSRVLTHAAAVQWRYLSKETGKTFKVTINPPSEDAPYTLSKEQEDLITKGDPKKVVKLNELMLRLYVRKEQGGPLPDQIRKEDIESMLDSNHTQLMKYMSYLVKRSALLKSQARKKDERKVGFEEVSKKRTELADQEYPWLNYHVHGNNLFPRIHKSSVQTFYSAYTATGLQFGQQVIIDCSFEDYMEERHLKHTAKQIIFCHVYNRKDRRPLGLHLCNFKEDGRLAYYLSRLHPQFRTDLPIQRHSGSYMNLFERKRLVYLTPHTHTTLKYSPDDIYILGGIVDKELGLNLTGKKALKEEIRHACLPLGQVKWKLGSKLLCIHHCFNILLQVKNTRDWKQALLDNVPERKLLLEGDRMEARNMPSRRVHRAIF